MRILFIFSLVIFCSGISGQTRDIAFKSHSGSKENYKAYLENTLFGSELSNFGMAPQRIIKTAKLDSVIFISDTVAVMVTSKYCTDRYNHDSTSLWRAGKDTVFNHPLFTRKHSLDSIRYTLKKQYHFRNNMDSVSFIGYDNEARPQSDKPKKNETPVTTPGSDHHQGPFDGQLLLAIGMIAVLSVFAGILFRRPLQNR
jgi:hypothetical protein